MQEFLTTINAQLSPTGVVSFDNSESLNPEQSYATVLGGDAFIQVKGVDATKFLQGQVTCDMNDISMTQMRFGAHCTHKGRMIASFMASKIDSDTHLLKTTTDNIENLLNSLKKYIVFSQAEASIAENWVAIGLSGADSESVISQFFGNLPTGTNQKIIKDNIHCHQIVGGKRYEIWLSQNQAQVFWQHCSNLASVSSLTWQLEDIRAGIGKVIASTTEKFIPQAINLHEVGGVSFTKGCYTGQEIVARMKYLGKQKRHMAHFSADGISLTAGSNVYLQNSDKNVGEVVNCVTTSNNTCEGLVVITDDALLDTIVDDSKQLNLKFTALNYA
jgi:folate-binding protein YgfZ